MTSMDRQAVDAKEFLIYLHNKRKLVDGRINRDQIRDELVPFGQLPSSWSYKRQGTGTVIYVLKMFKFVAVRESGQLLVLLPKGIALLPVLESFGETRAAQPPTVSKNRARNRRRNRRRQKRLWEPEATATAATDAVLPTRVERHDAVKISSNYDIVNDEIAVGDVQIDLPNIRPKVRIILENTSADDIEFCSWKLQIGAAIQNIYDSSPFEAMTMEPGDRVPAEVRCNGGEQLLGRRRDYCTFKFRSPATGFEFQVSCFLGVRYVDAVTCLKEIKPIGRYTPKTGKEIIRTEKLVGHDSQIKPHSPAGDQLDITKVPVKNYKEMNVKEHLSSQFNNCHEDHWWVKPYQFLGMDGLQDFPMYLKHLVGQPMTPANHKMKHLALLLLEHRQEEVDIHSHDMHSTTMAILNTFLKLKVPGLAENRPSLLRNDYLVADKKWKGFVHKVERDGVSLKFDARFQRSYINGQPCSITFSVNPTLWWLKNRAVCTATDALTAHDDLSMLFPITACLKAGGRRRLISKFFNDKVERNPEQRSAVENIVAKSSGIAPYLVFGPPGTGKTTTVVEAILQVKEADPVNCRVLVCCPSNSAADLVTSRVLSSKRVPAKYILRLIAQSRNKSAVEDDVLDVSKYDDTQGCFYFPSLAEILGCKIVVCTLTTSGRLVSAGLPRGHFSHIFIDECGHAVEAESLIPLAGMVEPGQTQVVLAGDPCQLGPIIRSGYAKSGQGGKVPLEPHSVDGEGPTHGLDVSFLERLMTTCELYQRKDAATAGGSPPTGTYNALAFTKLVQNYRSHPEILKVPNELFYNGELQACADKLDREKLCEWTGLPRVTKKRKSGPIIFHGIVGKDDREKKSPSFFNDKECTLVEQYLDKLKASRGNVRLADRDIGVISPYHNQVTKIRAVLRQAHGSVKVGSVEEFQGQERTVIIISTVRSQQKYTDLDETFGLGFLRNEKRFNVAITRAKALLIIIGNPNVLKKEPCWKEFLTLCVDNGWYTSSINDDCIYPVSSEGIDGWAEDEESFLDNGLTDYRQDQPFSREEHT